MGIEMNKIGHESTIVSSRRWVRGNSLYYFISTFGVYEISHIKKSLKM